MRDDYDFGYFADEAIYEAQEEMKNENDYILGTLDEEKEMTNSFHKRVFFENGWGVSVISHRHSYGGAQGLFEVAVIDSDEKIRYDSGVTRDVIGWLDFAGVADVMVQVKELPKRV